jgi:hypothetical protein
MARRDRAAGMHIGGNEGKVSRSKCPLPPLALLEDGGSRTSTVAERRGGDVVANGSANARGGRIAPRVARIT